MRTPLSEAALRQIYGDTIDALYGYASRRCGGVRELAEDITQDVWLRAVQDWRAKGVPENPLAWLTTVARNLILNQFRRKEGESIDVIPAEEILAAVDEDDVRASANVASVVNRALERIPENEARLIEAFHFERFKVAQLADAYGVSERAIEGRLRRARERLRHELEITLKAEGGLT